MNSQGQEFGEVRVVHRTAAAAAEMIWVDDLALARGRESQAWGVRMPLLISTMNGAKAL